MRSWLLILPLFILLQGCSGLWDSLKEESEQAERESRKEDAFSTGGRAPSANSQDDFVPGMRKKIREKADDFDDGFNKVKSRAEEEIGSAKRRYTRADFTDTSPGENSLWNAQGQSNYYFSQNNRFDSGDLVIVTIDRGLRREIQYALWKSLPSDQRKMRRKPASEGDKAKDAADGAKQAATDAAATAKAAADEAKAAAEDATKGGAPDKDNDLVRMEIIENMGNGLVRLQGQKRVIYRGHTKFVEVSALVRGRDIDEQAKTNSKQFLDMRTRVVQ